MSSRPTSNPDLLLKESETSLTLLLGLLPLDPVTVPRILWVTPGVNHVKLPTWRALNMASSKHGELQIWHWLSDWLSSSRPAEEKVCEPFGELWTLKTAHQAQTVYPIRRCRSRSKIQTGKQRGNRSGGEARLLFSF